MKRWALLACGLVIICALLDLRVGLRGDLQEASKEAMKAAADKVRQLKKPGDVIVHSPLFSVVELSALGKMNAKPDLPVPRVRSSRRVLLLDRQAQPMYFPGSVKETIALSEGLVLRIFEPSGEIDAPLFELYESITEKTMQVHRGAKKTLCTQARPEGGFRCPGEPEWLYAAQRTLKVGGKQSPCVWAHPTNGGAILLQIPALPASPAGKKLNLTVSSGLNDDATRSPDGAPVYTEIQQSGRTLARITLPNRKGWQKKTVELQPGAPAWLKITSPKDGVRHHCVNAQVKEAQ